jgi:hypothetical protein
MPALSQSLLFPITTGNTTTNSVQVTYPVSIATSTVYYSSIKVKGDGYFGSSNGFHTVGYSAIPTFEGTIKMQATLASEPVETDWFDIVDTSVTYASYDARTESTMDIFNFTGNFVWVRGNVSIDAGAVMYINYNH